MCSTTTVRVYAYLFIHVTCTYLYIVQTNTCARCGFRVLSTRLFFLFLLSRLRCVLFRPRTFCATTSTTTTTTIHRYTPSIIRVKQFAKRVNIHIICTRVLCSGSESETFARKRYTYLYDKRRDPPTTGSAGAEGIKNRKRRTEDERKVFPFFPPAPSPGRLKFISCTSE